MEKYNYYEAVKEDVLNYISNQIDYSEFEDLEDLEEYLNERLWADDDVTGNASGSYTFSTYTAEENLAHNWDLLAEAFSEFGCEDNPFEKGAEYCDITIRCYLLGSAISEALREIEDDFNEAHEEEEGEDE